MQNQQLVLAGRARRDRADLGTPGGLAPPECKFSVISRRKEHETAHFEREMRFHTLSLRFPSAFRSFVCP